MKKFHRRRGMIITQLSAYEVELLASLIMQLIELISDGEPEGFAEEIHEERAGLDIGLPHRPVDGDRDMRHGGLLCLFLTARFVGDRRAAGV